MKFGHGALLCFFVLAVCFVEASSIRQKIVLTAKQKQKESFDDISSILNEDTTSPYAYLEGKTDSIASILNEPRFLQKKQVDASVAAPTITATVPVSPVAVPTMDDITTNTIPATIADPQSVYVSGTPGSSPQLTAIPSVVSTQTMASEEEEDPEMSKLSAGLEAVKEDIVGNSKQIGDEKKWVSAVKAITNSYDDKMKRVNEHITVLRKEQKKLFDKKKQIENLKLQKRLQSKLSLASDELKTLQSSLDHVQEKSHELKQEHSNLKSTIKKIESQLTKLKGASAHSEKSKGHEGGKEGGHEKGSESEEEAGPHDPEPSHDGAAATPPTPHNDAEHEASSLF